MPLSLGKQSSYQQYKPNIYEPRPYVTGISIGDLSEISLDIITMTTKSIVFQKSVALEPVYVEKIDGEERLAYNSNMMKPEKEYRIIWNNEHFVLIKKDNQIDIYKFYPDP